jgi:hypothetical protein
MADAGQNNSTKKIGLDEALLRLTPEILYYKPVVPGWRTYVVHPCVPISQVFWKRRELAIEELDAATCNGGSTTFAFNEKTGELIEILTSRWREHQRGWRREMIISGAVKASTGDAKLWEHYQKEGYRLLTDDTWLEQFARKSAAAISVSEAPATADHAVAEPVSREHAETFDKGMSDREQRPNSVNTPASAAHPGDSLEGGARRGARRGRKVKYDWPVYQAELFGRLFYDDIGPHDEINIAQMAADLMTWGQRHLSDEKTPEDSAMVFLAW